MLPAHLGGAFLSPGQLTHNREFKLAAMHSSVHACSPLLGVLSQYTALLRRTSLSRLSGPVGSVQGGDPCGRPRIHPHPPIPPSIPHSFIHSSIYACIHSSIPPNCVATASICWLLLTMGGAYL